jgi:SAM-dependent methyltransferase/uncharacterized protein YbaR (Trm112 family)
MMLDAVLRCPRCERGALRDGAGGLVCSQCSSGFPRVGGIPWLFEDPALIRAEWRARLGLLLAHLREESARHAVSAGEGMLETTRRRLGHLAAAYADQATRLEALLAPLALEAPAAGPDLLRALGTRLPADQGLSNYYVNVHRDWCWGEAENRAAVAQLARVLDAPLAGRRVLVLGAGAGRLAYDLHRRESPALTVALDFNPLLLFVAREVTAGRRVGLYEFPIAPRTIADHAVLRDLAAPAPVDEGFVLVAGDAMCPPFAPGAFDAVVTPWLIDIVDEPFPPFAARIHTLLADGGRWLNFGSLAFAQADRRLRFGLEESCAIVASAGFAAPTVVEDTIPYMQSPASRHARLERVVSWQAIKAGGVPAPPAHARVPPWLRSPDEPVPLTTELQTEAVTVRIRALLLSLVDGRRSVRDIARMLVEQRLMRAEDAEEAVRRFLLRIHDDASRRDDFHG